MAEMTNAEMIAWLKQIEKDIYVCSLESTFRDDAKSCAIHKAIELLERDPCDVIRCKDCKWFGFVGCAINIVDDSDKPRKYDFCSFAERKDLNEQKGVCNFCNGIKDILSEGKPPAK